MVADGDFRAALRAFGGGETGEEIAAAGVGAVINPARGPIPPPQPASRGGNQQEGEPEGELDMVEVRI